MAGLDDLALAQALADHADRIARAAFVEGRAIEHELKADGSPVTAVDLAVEAKLLEVLRHQRADDGVVGEEVGAHGDPGSGRCWTLDGIDGTAGFVAGSPLWSTLIGLVIDGTPQLGVSTSVGQQRRWWAQVGDGSWSAALDGNGRVSAARPLRSARAARGELPLAWVEPRPPADTSPGIARLMGRVRHVEMTTHPAQMVASGELDLAFMHAAGIWDVVPLIPLVTEAGGSCFSSDGGMLDHLDGDVIFTGEHAAAELPSLLAASRGERRSRRRSERR